MQGAATSQPIGSIAYVPTQPGVKGTPYTLVAVAPGAGMSSIVYEPWTLEVRVHPARLLVHLPISCSCHVPLLEQKKAAHYQSLVKYSDSFGYISGNSLTKFGVKGMRRITYPLCILACVSRVVIMTVNVKIPLFQLGVTTMACGQVHT